MTEAPYGTWHSPIDGDAVARDRGWTYSMVTASGGAVYWSEARPLEDGRDAIVVRRPGEPPADAIPSAYNARTRVHEYGGGAFTVHDGAVYFCHDDDQRIYRLASEPEPITPPGARYADLQVTPDGRRLVCVRERDGDPEHINDLVALPTDGSAEPEVIASGHDFYAAPRVSPDGTRIAWLAWDHPRMPWEAPSSTSTGGSSPAARPRRSSSPTGARTASFITAPTAQAGGTCTAKTERR